MSVPDFLAESFGAAPLHVPGPATRFAPLAAAEDEASPALTALAHNLELDLEAPVRAAFRADWAGLPLHHGEQDLLVLQIAGQDAWRVHGRESGQPAAEPTWEAVLEEGGALYVPRGCWYSAAPRRTPSRNLTLHIENPTGADLLVWLSDKLKLHEAFAADIPRFAGPAAKSAYLVAMRHAITHAFRLPHLIERYSQRLNEKAAIRSVSGSRWSERESREGCIAFSTPRRPTIRRRDNETIFILAGGVDFLFPTEAAPLLQFLIDKAPVPVAEFYAQFEGEFDRDEISEFLSVLSGAGIVGQPLLTAAGDEDSLALRKRPMKGDPGQGGPPHDTAGWLPIEIAFDPQPAVVTEAPVKWLEFGSTPLAEPFFSQTAANLRKLPQPAREIETDIETMLRISARLPAVRPAGFIFHVSHCGSTVLSNALKLAPHAVVASEPTALARLARRYADPPSAYLKARWNDTRRTLLDSVCRLLAHYRTGETQPLVIKFASLNLMGMKTVRSCWPDTPCVVLVRNPAEVMVTALREQGWMAWKADANLASEIFGWTDLPRPLTEMSGEEYCARALGRLLGSALDTVDENCKVIDYEDLNRKRIGDIASFFGLELPGENESLDRVLAYYAKDPESRRPFQDDCRRKRRLATPAVHEAAQQWAMPAYSELRGKGFW